MTIPVSTTTDNPFVKNYTRYRFGENKNTLIAYIIFNVLSYPLFFFLALLFSSSGSVFNMHDSTDFVFVAGSMVSLMAIFAIAVFPIIFAFKNFKYLHEKTLTDMSFSLPITRAGRFWSDYLSGLFSLIVPYIISSAIGMVLFGITQGLFYDTFDNILSEISINPNLSLLVFQLMLAGLIYLVTTYSITVLASSLSGLQKGATGLGFFFLLCVPAIIGLLLSALFHYDNYGLVLESFIGQLITAINPFAFVALSGPSLAYDELGFSVFAPQVIIPLLAIAALCVVGAYFVCKNRKVEKIGTTIISKGLNIAVSAAVVFLATGFFWLVGIDSNNEFRVTTWIFIFVAAVIITIISEIKHGIKKIGIELLKLIVYVGGSILIIFLCTLVRSFGMASYVPAVSEVKFVESDVLCNEIMPNSYHVIGENQSFRYSSPEAIEAFIEAQKKVIAQEGIDSRTTTKGSFVYYTSFGSNTIKYHMNDGSVVRRQYDFTNSYIKELAPIFGDAEQKASVFETLDNSFNGPNREIQLTNIAGEYVTTVPDEFEDKLYQAIKKDYTSLTFEQLYADDSEILVAIKLMPKHDPKSSSAAIFYIKSYYTETLEVLNEIGFSDLSKFSAENINEVPELCLSNFSVVCGFPYEMGQSYTLNPSDEAVKALFKKLQATYMTMDGSYTVNLNGLQFIVPKTYFDEAQKLFKAKEDTYADVSLDETDYWIRRDEASTIKRIGLACIEKSIDQEHWYYSEYFAAYRKEANERLTQNISPITDVFGSEINLWLNYYSELPEDEADILEKAGISTDGYESNIIENSDADYVGIISDSDYSLPCIVFAKNDDDIYDELSINKTYSGEYMALYVTPDSGFTVLTFRNGSPVDDNLFGSDDMLNDALEYIMENL